MLPLLGLLGRGLSSGLGGGLLNGLSGAGKFGSVAGLMGQGLADSAAMNKLQKGFQDKMEVLQMEQAIQQATHSFAKTTSQNISQT
jgi:hypothetical protein